MDKVDFSEWKKIEIKVGKVIVVEKIPNRDKLYKLQVDVGEEKPRQIITGLVPYYKESKLLNKLIIVLTNLKPATFAGEISNGMLLAAEKEDGSKCVLLTVDQEIEPGTIVT
ncbi:MAG: tRNA-binding protein [Patescibacteria group bacterium]|nr:tRNA-binding protein [Patescibacteria group bacterium]